jgi:hypothetical protein
LSGIAKRGPTLAVFHSTDIDSVVAITKTTFPCR